MKRLILLRHAKSSWDNPGLTDHDRPLAKRGILDAPKIGKFLESNNIIPELIICSTALRAKETLNLVYNEIKKNVKIIFNESIYNSNSNELVNLISGTDNDITKLMIIGHNPDLEYLVEILTDKDFPYTKYSTAGLAIIDFSIDNWLSITDTVGNLKIYKTPKML